mmetsp:Transcript_73709/g.130124  ORF Transcript_73709/g.130124 Transcript_73709/m.130124 type:complete len:192 (-) Transcript_73709:589-1164(-)
MRLARNGTMPAPTEAATEKSAESAELRSLRSFAMVMVMAWAGPAPRARAETANSTAKVECGRKMAGTQPNPESVTPVITTEEGSGVKQRMAKGARAKRLAAKRSQKRMFITVAVPELNPVCVRLVMSHVPHATSTPTARALMPAQLVVKRLGSLAPQFLPVEDDSGVFAFSDSLGSARKSSEITAVTAAAM